MRSPRSRPISRSCCSPGNTDPVSNGGSNVRVLEQRMRGAGLDVEAIYYPGARHEVLNETNREQVHRELLGWLERIESGH